MSDIRTQYSKKTLITGDASPYRWSGLATGRGSEAELTVEFDVTEDNLADGDKWYIATLPKDFVISDIIASVDQLDTDGSAALTLSLNANDGTTTTSFTGTAETDGQTGGIFSGDQNLPLEGGADDIEVYFEVEASAGTAAAGKARATIRGTRTLA